METARARRALLLATGMLIALSPAGLGQLPAPALGGAAGRLGGPLSVAGVEPNGLELVAPDLLGVALRLELGPGYAGAAPSRGELAPDFTSDGTIPFRAASAAAVAEPPRALLLLLMLASGAGACRERRRSRTPPRHP